MSATPTTPGYLNMLRIQRKMAYEALRNDSAILSAVADAVDEAYANIEALEGRIEALEEATAMTYEYDAATRGIIISNGGGSASNGSDNSGSESNGGES